MVLLSTTALGYRNLPAPANIGDKARPDDSAVLQITSTTKGFLGPRMNTAERDAIVAPATGLLIYNTDTLSYETFGGVVWSAVGGAGADHPLWTTGTDYEIGTVIIEGTAFKIYRANVAHTSGATFAGDIANWDELSDDLNREISSTDNALVVWDGTGGDDVKDSVLITSGTGNRNLTTIGDIEADTIIGTTDIQTGNITISGNTVESTDASGDLLLDTNAGEVRVLDDLIAEGNFTVNGTTTTINSTTLTVADQQIVVNSGGNQASANANDAGVLVEMSDATDAGLFYDSTFTSLFGVGLFNDFREIVTVDQAQDVTGKTLLEVDNLQLDGNTIASTDVNGNVEIDANGTGITKVYDDTEFLGSNHFKPSDVLDGFNIVGSSGGLRFERHSSGNLVLFMSENITNAYFPWRFLHNQTNKTIPNVQIGSGATGFNNEASGTQGMYLIANNVNALNVFEDEVDVPTLPFRVGEITLGATANQIESITGDLTIASADEVLIPETVKANYVMAGDALAGTAVDASAILEAKSTTKGSIPFPKMTEAQRDAITTPSEGLTVFNTDTNQANIFSNGAWIPLGSGGGGGLDVFYTERFEEGTDETDFSCGNNATFLGGGTLDGTADLEEVTVIKGDNSFEYTAGATQANTEDDYCASPIINLSSKEGDGGKFIGINFWYTYSGLDDEVTVVVYDDTNNVVISSSLDLLEASADPIRYSTSVYVPDGVTELRWGFQFNAVPTSASNVLRIDEVELTLNPYSYKDLIEPRVFVRGVNNGGTTITANVTPIDFSMIDNSNTYWDNNEFTAPYSTTYQVGGIVAFTTSVNDVIKAYISTDNGSSYAVRTGVFSGFDNDADDFLVFNGTVNLNKGDRLQIRSSTGGTLSNDSNHYITIASMGDVTSEHVVTPMEAGSQLIRYDGFTSITSNFLKLATRQFNKDSNGNDTSPLFEDDNTGTFTKITAKERINIVATAGGEHSTANTVRIDRYNSSDVLQESNKNEQNTGFNSAVVTLTTQMEEGDYLKVFYNIASPTVTDAESFWLQVLATPTKYKATVATPVEQVATFAYSTSGSRQAVTTTATAVPLAFIEGDNFATVSSNQITLPKGKYVIDFDVNFFISTTGNIAVGILHNVTTTSDVSLTDVGYVDSGTSSLKKTSGIHIVTLTEPAIYELRVKRDLGTTNIFVGDTYTGSFANNKALVKIRKLK